MKKPPRKYAKKIAAVAVETCGTWSRPPPSSSPLIPPTSAPRCASSTLTATPQIASCSSETAPTPITLPQSSENGRTDDTSTSTIRVVFSSSTELSTVVAEPEIFWVASLIGRFARAITAGLMPARSRRAVVTTLESTRSSCAMSRSDETVVARYSIAPLATTSPVRMRMPSRRLAPTTRMSESSTPGVAATRVAWNASPARSASVTRSPNGDAVPSTTTMRFGPAEPARDAESTITPANNSGTRNADTQNHLLRTRSTNSRRMTAPILRTPRHLLPPLGSHEVVDNLVQRGLHQLEAGQPRPGLDELPQHLLRVGPVRELELGVLPVVVDLLAEAAVGKQSRRAPRLAVEADGEILSAGAPLDVGERAVHQFPASRDDAQLVAQLLRLLHDVRGEEHGRAAVAQLEHHVLEHLGVHRIEPRERLVQDHERRLVQHGRDELHLLLHPLGELVDAPRPPVAQAQPLEPYERALARHPSFHAFHFREEHEHIHDPHLAVQSTLLGEVSNPGRVVAGGAALAEQAHLPRVGEDDVQDHAERGRLAGAVRPEQAVDSGRRDRERQAIHGGVARELLGHAVEHDDRRRHRANEAGGGGGEGRGGRTGRGSGGSRFNASPRRSTRSRAAART